jgi:hypothetical protein
MTAQTRPVLKALFEDGDKPSGSNYSDWVDSMVSIADSTAQTMTSDLKAPKFIATTEVSAPTGSFAAVNTSSATLTGPLTGTNIVLTGSVSASSMSLSGPFTGKDIILTGRVSASSMSLTGPFTGKDITLTGRVSASSASLSGDATIDGVVQVGAAGERGFVQLVQQKDITPNTAKVTAAVLPDGSDVLDMYFMVKTAFATAAADVVLRVGTSANETAFGTISMDTNIATGMHHLANAAFTSAGTPAAWSDVSGAATKIYVAVTAVSGAVASGASGVLSIVYVKKE